MATPTPQPRQVAAPDTPPHDSSHNPGSGLVRGLGTWDGALLTVGSIVGTGIFITTADMAKVLPHSGLILLVWLAGGLLTLAGALTYGELGAMFPRAGGLYHYVREAYGPLWGFLYGWTAFLVIMSGGIAALGVAFGEYLGSFLPFFSTGHILLEVPVLASRHILHGLPWALSVGPWTWQLSGGQVAAALAILVLTAVNHFGLKEGAWTQNALTVIKIGAIVLFAGLGLLAPAKVAPHLTAPISAIPGGLLAAFGVAMIAALWTYDGWYGLTCSAGEVRDPGKNLPRGLILGTALVILLYMMLNLVYIRALDIPGMAATPRIAETAAAVLFGPTGARLMSLAVLISTFGCLSSTILYSSRIYLPMAEDGLFFRSLAKVDPRYRVPIACLWAQTAWSLVLTFSGSYSQLYTYAIFAGLVFHGMIGASVFILRRTRPDAPRPYRTWGYPVVPALFILACLLLIGNTLKESPLESLLGLGLVALGVPAYWMFRRRNAVSAS